MIDLKTLKDSDMKRLVVYTDGTGDKQEGHITSWNNVFIFVDYGKSCGRGEATDPRDLDWLIGL
ncbi:hypothetical protein LCGC14_1458590 [marine sediment metagenome]|uniref:Uncharacterized protein n=1 Tax=marine sediment metagenome TaxID=412755 RepID=A0A0F9MHQ7_9ZZZZ